MTNKRLASTSRSKTGSFVIHLHKNVKTGKFASTPKSSEKESSGKIVTARQYRESNPRNA